jgi:hypothetical protein
MNTPTCTTPQGACDARGRPHAGDATRFVSHAWRCPFADLLAALLARAEEEAHVASAEDEYLWIGAARMQAAALPARMRVAHASLLLPRRRCRHLRGLPAQGAVVRLGPRFHESVCASRHAHRPHAPRAAAVAETSGAHTLLVPLGAAQHGGRRRAAGGCAEPRAERCIPTCFGACAGERENGFLVVMPRALTCMCTWLSTDEPLRRHCWCHEQD